MENYFNKNILLANLRIIGGINIFAISNLDSKELLILCRPLEIKIRWVDWLFTYLIPLRASEPESWQDIST